jgi:prepilin-type N-terminal cleavage/methylation domain-containing protein
MTGSVSRARKNGGGYTLIEMMIVITIIGILFAIILPNMTKSRFQAQFSACQLNQRNMASALENYNTDQKSYPASGQISVLWSAQYMSQRPFCPSNASDYGYETTNRGGESSVIFNAYTIYCNGIHYLVLPGITRKGYPQYVPDEGTLLGRP